MSYRSKKSTKIDQPEQPDQPETLSNLMFAELFVAIVLVSILAPLAFLSFFPLPNPQGRPQWQWDLTQVKPACNVEEAMKATGISADNLLGANSSGTQNGIQIWLKSPQVITIPDNANVVHHPIGNPFGISYPTEQTPGKVRVFTLYWPKPCRSTA